MTVVTTVMAAAPTITFTYPLDQDYIQMNNSKMNLTFTVTDDANLTTLCWITLNGTSMYYAVVSNDTPYNVGTNETILENITYLVQVNCSDGTEQTNSSIHSAIVDNTPPSATIIGLINNSAYNQTYIFLNYSVSEPNLNYSSFYCQRRINLSNKADSYYVTTSSNCDSTNSSCTSYNFTNMSYGEYYCWGSFLDKTGVYYGWPDTLIKLRLASLPSNINQSLSTNLSNTSLNLENVSNFKLASSTIVVQWDNSQNLTNTTLDFATDVDFGNKNFTINASTINLLGTATITMTNLSYTNTPTILKDGVACSTCGGTNYTSTNGTLRFYTTSFSTYALSSNDGGSTGGGGGGGSRTVDTTNTSSNTTTTTKSASTIIDFDSIKEWIRNNNNATFVIVLVVGFILFNNQNKIKYKIARMKYKFNTAKSRITRLIKRNKLLIIIAAIILFILKNKGII